MKEIEYVIKDPVGIHARPAGVLVKTAEKFTSKITMKKGETSVDVKRMFHLMTLGVKCNDTIQVTIEGADEEEAATAIREVLEKYL